MDLHSAGASAGQNILNLLYKYQNHEIALATSLARYDAYWKAKIGLRADAPFAGDSDYAGLIPVKWHKSYSANYMHVLLPAVLGSVWEAPDGKKALVLYNITEKPDQSVVSLKGNLENSLSGVSRVSSVFPDDVAIKDATVTLTLPPRVPIIMELEEK